MTVKIATDSASDINPEEAQKLGIIVVPLTVNMDGVPYRDDGVDLTTRFFYKSLLDSDNATTTMPNKEEILAAWKSGSANSEIVMIDISSKLSGTFNQAKEAAKKRPNVRVVDSLNVGAGLQFLVLEALAMARAGKKADCIVTKIEELKPKIRFYGVFETLRYLERGGRIGRVKALLGSLLNIKPIVSLQDGELVPVGRERTKQKAIDKMIEKFCVEGKMAKIAVIHAGVEGEANTLKATLTKRFPGMEILIVQLGPTLGVHSGPGLVGVCGLLE